MMNKLNVCAHNIPGIKEKLDAIHKELESAGAVVDRNTLDIWFNQILSENLTEKVNSWVNEEAERLIKGDGIVEPKGIMSEG